MNSLVLDPTHLEPPVHHHRLLRQPEAFHLHVDEKGIAWLTFDSPESQANVFNEATLRELDDHLDAVELDPSIHALVIRSAKEKIFIAGADLKAVRSLPPAEVDGLIRLGQAVFSRLASLPVPTLAAIHGACAGGGTELTLACDARIASDDNVTRIGLPETQLGLIPAWGGCTRLPRLIGLRSALDMILSGKLLSAKDALKRGLIAKVVPKDRLEAEAGHIVLSLTKSRPHRRFWDTLWPISSIIGWQTRRLLLAKTRGLYAAPLKALETVLTALRLNLETALELERTTMLSLAQSEATVRLIDLFFRKEAASKSSASSPHQISRVAVIGAGVMGSGIAQWLVSRGIHVLMCDVKPEAIAAGLARVNERLSEAVKRRLMTKQQAREAKDRLAVTAERVPLTSYHLVIEAATEDIGLKKKIFADIAPRVSEDTLLATNTSALGIREIATAVPMPDRVIGLHFFNPVHRMPLVEIIAHRETSDIAIGAAVAFSRAIGKTPVVVKDSPGFVVNRILTPYLMEAVKLHAQGHPAAVIDEAMLDFGMPMGPLRLLDEIGLDVAAHVASTLHLDASLLTPMIGKGHLGVKTGRGFYDHSPGIKHPRTSWAHVPWLQDQLADLMSDEAKKVLREDIASAAEIDLAMVLGTGYPPFRGGPLSHARVFR
ncbi:MAG: enoyl-CoA hydratase/isomerase family protein [Verrucomicrobiaceae bacterium]|nr:enoyl-CoA hydratase/isomerase family protein [Verrucomicrobiaceae bacterium]